MNKVTIDLDTITSEMDTLKQNKARLQFDLKEVEKEIEKRELQLVALLSQKGVNEMQYGVYTFGLKTSKRTAFDSKLFQEKNPEIYEQFKTTKEYEKFSFKVNK